MNLRARFSKGQMLAVFTIVLPVLLGAMALGADFAVIYFNWSMVQKAADAAALAGASQLTAVPGSAASLTSAVDNYVNGYACLNGIHNGTSTLCTAGASQNGYADNIAFTNVTDTQVSVGIHRSVPYFFGKMIGLQEAGVAAKATAAIEATGSVPSGMFPVGLQCTPTGNPAACNVTSLFSGQDIVTFGAKFVLTSANSNEESSGGAPGNWDWVDVGQGNGASQLGQMLQSGSAESFSIGQTINSVTGNKANSNPAKSGLAARLAACAPVTSGASGTDPCSNGGNTSALKCNDPCLITVPAVNFTGCNGNCTLTIEGFAEMYLEQTSTTSAIQACYISTNNCQTEGSASAPNLGSLSPPVLIN
jgi:Putative Flp pilus-assembly TadE/G-like